MYLLDTNVVSELRRRRPHGAVVAWVATTPADELHIAAVTLGEIQIGIEMTREQDRAKAAEIEAWSNHVLQTWKIVPMDGIVFREWAKLMHRRSDDLLLDAMIAATALVHDFKVVTRNIRDFEAFGVDVLNPFETR
jgi:predicted nucleic acid-binding protein